jgi:phosphoribosylformimino-5-aminoimidazole carboxamide ribotide isomerase
MHRGSDMQVIPAVDIRGGRCVRLVQGKFDQETVFSDDPVQMAVHWASLGAKRLHVVDLDGARTGEPRNLEVVRRIVEAVTIPVQLGGGIRTCETAEEVLALGVDRAIIGTSAAVDRDLAHAVFKRFGDRVAVGIDGSDGRVAIRGWQEILEEKAVDFAREMESLGARRIVYTDIARDGMLQGPNIAAVEEIARAVAVPVIASGGVAHLEDIRSLKGLEPLGVEGVIVGKALYTESLDLRKAIRIAGD